MKRADIIGSRIPNVSLQGSDGSLHQLADLSDKLVLYFYPATGRPDADPVTDPAPGWDNIPGAAGCTPQSLGFRNLLRQFEALGFKVAGVSGQDHSIQAEFAARHNLGFLLLSDPTFALADHWHLPTFSVGEKKFYSRLIAIIESSQVQHLFFPVTEPSGSSEMVLSWLQSHSQVPKGTLDKEGLPKLSRTD